MNWALFLRYYLELAIFVPAAVLVLIPAQGALRIKPRTAYAAGVALTLLLAACGAVLCVRLACPAARVIPFIAAVCLAAYWPASELEASKKLFCFFNATMICTFSVMYTHFVTAPLELVSPDVPFTWQSGLACLGLAAMMSALFFSTLRFKVPLLFGTESLNRLWRGLLLLPLFCAALIYWMTPVSYAVIMTGRVRSISLVLTLFVPLSVWGFYHFFWLITVRFSDSARLQQENTLLQMENKRYSELRSYMDASRALRHDFRQHLLVIGQYAREGKTETLLNYLHPMLEKAESAPPRFCLNPAADAIAAHYARLAEETHTAVSWRLELPGTLPLPESDYCAVLGNLLENALHAVTKLPEDKRRVEVVSVMLSDAMLGISVSNPYAGRVRLGKSGLPVAVKLGHGLGLTSVSNIVKRCRGTLDIKTENGVFSVDILMYCAEQSD